MPAQAWRQSQNAFTDRMTQKATIEKILRERVMVLDGAMGVMIQHKHLTESDFSGQQPELWDVPQLGNNDLLCITNPDIIRKIHRDYLEAGADIIETNTFNAQAISQADYHTTQYVEQINLCAARIAKEEAERMTRLTPDKPRFVAGSIGPTGKTASMSPDVDNPAMRTITFDELFCAYQQQIMALVKGGIDILLIETIFDTLNAKAAIMAAKNVFGQTGTQLPIMLSITIADAAGRMLTGQDIEAFVTSVTFAQPLSIGINCSFGPAQLRPYIKQLRNVSPFYVSAYPNAGLPNAMGEYDETPESMAKYMRELLDEGLVDIVGGCCGTTPEHIWLLAHEVENCMAQRTERHVQSSRTQDKHPWLSGIDAFTPIDGTFINVGERCNVAGSRKFLKLICGKQYEEALAIARKQVRDGAMLIDVNMDDGMLDTKEEMTTFLNIMASDPEVARVPWMIDSSKFDVIEAALKCVQGKAVVNSISLKEGEQEFLRRARVINSYGAAMVVMAFDEKGQATTRDRKIEICKRAYNLLTKQADVAPEDIIFDPNVLTIATGMKEHDRYALDFIEAVEWIKKNLHGARVSGGVSNLSFAFRGNNYLREAMHAVFLYHAIRKGMDMAIVNPASNVSYDDIPDKLLEALEDVILCRHVDAAERLTEIANEYCDKKTGIDDSADNRSGMSLEERIMASIQRGDSEYLQADLQEALALYPSPQAIIEGPLMRGMENVGNLFGKGKMFLPQVVKSARIMKQAVNIVMQDMAGNHLTGVDGEQRPTFLLATVKGDVHDIGKNIAAVVLGCNNFNVIDLGVMVSADRIVEEAKTNKVDFIGLSGLITPSLNEMCIVASELKKAGVSAPLFIGGATTSAIHTAVKIAPLYDGPVFHVKDASQNPVIATQLMGEEHDSVIAVLKTEQERMRQAANRPQHTTTISSMHKLRIDWSKEQLATPTYLGIRKLDAISITEIRPFINWKYFYHLWRVSPGTSEADNIRNEAELMINRLTEEQMTLRAIIGFYHAYGTDSSIFVQPENNDSTTCSQLVEIPTPRQRKQNKHGNCLSLCDYVAPKGYGDHIGMFAITISSELTYKLEQLKSADDDYNALLLQSVCDRLVEAASEWLHHVVRKHLWGYSPDETVDIPGFYKADYRGIRPAVGYPSLPDQKVIFRLNELLQAEDIGIKLTENGAMYPQSSVCGLYLASPHSEYFLI